MNYTIQCYVQKISSVNTIQIRGIDGYRLERKIDNAEKEFNVFWEEGNDNVKIKPIEEEEFEFSNNQSEQFQMLLEAKLHNQKIELEISKFASNKITIEKVTFI